MDDLKEQGHGTRQAPVSLNLLTVQDAPTSRRRDRAMKLRCGGVPLRMLVVDDNAAIVERLSVLLDVNVYEGISDGRVRRFDSSTRRQDINRTAEYTAA